jgi:hypothetical protein
MKWTELEISYLTDNLNKTSSELSKILSRSRKSIIRKIKQLNLLDEYKKNNLFIGRYIDEKKEENRRLNISNSCKKNKKSGGLRKGSGRGKKGTYKGYWCDSSYELAWVIYNLDNNIIFKRNTKKFKYLNNDIEEKFYIPDFIIDNVYYEIKGYKNSNLEYKIKYFPYELKVLFYKDIKHIIDYVIDKYGKNFISLYEDKKYKSCEKCNGYICKNNKSGNCISCIKKYKNTTKSKKILKRECICVEKIYNKSKNCKKCYDLIQRKVKNRPSIDNLVNDVKLIGYAATGRKYGVSDNTIRKWIKIGE